MVILAIISLWVTLSYVTYKTQLLNSKHPKWEKVMLSLSWPCVWIMWIFHKLVNDNK